MTTKIPYSKVGAAALSCLVNLVAGVSLLAQDIYWTEDDSIAASGIDGTGLTGIFDDGNMHGFAVDVVVTDDFIYWTDNAGAENSGGVWRAERDGSNAELLVVNETEITNPQFIAIDEVNGKIYISDWVSGLWVAELADGSDLTPVDQPSASSTGLALRSENELISVSAAAEDTNLYSTDLNTGESTVVAELGGNHQHYGFAYDDEADIAYIANFGDGALVSYDFGAEEVALVRGGLDGLLGVALSPSRTHLVLAQRGIGIGVHQIDNGAFRAVLARSEVDFGVAVAADPADIPSLPEGVAFQDTFDPWFPGQAPGMPPWTNVSHGEGRGTISVIADEEDRFGRGTDNRILEWRKDQTEDPMALQALGVMDEIPENEVMTFSFDFIDSGAPGSDDWVSLFLYSGERSTDNRAQRILIGRGTIGEAGYAPGQLVHVDIIVNNTTSDITHTVDGQEYTVIWQSFQTWIDGHLASEAFGRDTNQAGPITSLEFNSSSSDTFIGWFDNLTVYDEPRVRDIEIEVDPILFQDDFENQVVGEEPGAPWTDVAMGDDDGSIVVLQDEDEIFGKGPDNQYLEYLDLGISSSGLRALNTFSGAAASEIVTISFLFMEPDDPDHTDSLRLVPMSQGTRAQVPELGNGNIRGATYPLDEVHQVDFIFNNFADEAETVTYDTPDGGERTLEGGHFDVWRNGELVLESHQRAHDQAGPIDGFWFQGVSTNAPRIFFDDFVVRNFPYVTVPTEVVGFDDWLAEHFTEEQRADEAIGGPLGDPVGDGITNLMVYALGLDPWVSNAGNLPATSVQALEVDDETNEYLTLTFDRPDDIEDVTYLVTGSGDLAGWAEDPVQVSVTANGDGTVTELWRDGEPIEAADRRFLRLEVENP